MALPPLTERGDLPQGVHQATLREVLERFGVGTRQRKAVALRLERIYRAARASGRLGRFVVFGSFVTEDTFDPSKLEGETRPLFDHAAAQAAFGASVFWLRRLAAWESEATAIEYWQVKP